MIPGLGKSPGEGHGNPLFSYLAVRIAWTEEPCGLQSMESQRVRHDWATSTAVFSVCHGFLHPYRRIQYWGQTIQGGLETVGFYGHNLILSISIFFLIVKMKPIFFFQNNAASQDSWKRQLGLNLFFFQLLRKKSQLYKSSVYICPNIHCVWVLVEKSISRDRFCLLV